MKLVFKAAGAAFTGLFLSLAITSSAYAIKCNADSQVQKDGTEVITPYCQDSYLGKIARARGVTVTNAELRNSPSTKESVCLVVGGDARLSSICDGIHDQGPNDE